jgi:arsenic resistance protein ArsH
MKPSACYDRIVDVVEVLVRFTVLPRLYVDQLVDRYSERVEQDCLLETHVAKEGMSTWKSLPFQGAFLKLAY